LRPRRTGKQLRLAERKSIGAGGRRGESRSRGLCLRKPTLIRSDQVHLGEARIKARELAASRGVRDLCEGKALKEETSGMAVA